MKKEKQTKPCMRCGRSIEWRKKWERCWDEIRYCSDACRSTKLTETDERLEAAILKLLDARVAGETICPSEAARLVQSADWEWMMDDARRAARRLVLAGRIVITQNGRVVDPSTAKGAIRLKRK